jgi:peptidoglycan/xylan/chitin deacetylase (PgdA/CDA1 family)
VLALAVLAVVASATDSGPFSASKPPVPGKAPPSTPASKAKTKRIPRHTPGATIAAVDALAIDRVLSYTPFITGGVPRHRVVALTFDDGPSPYTPQIIRILVKMRVPATFFVVGQQLTDFSSALRDELRHGFSIGDHTENHAFMDRLSKSGQYKQIHDAAARIVRLGAPFPRLFRPPYGAYSSTTLSVLRGMKMLLTLWSVDTRDWTRPGTKAIISRALSTVRPGAIVLMHDGGGDRRQTVSALPAIISALRRRHYEFATVPQLLRLDPPPRHQRLPHVAE